MRSSEALTTLKRVLRTIEEGKVPYKVEEVTVYGSVVEGEKRVRDLDLYIQLDRESVPEEDLLQEIFGGHGRSAGTRLRMALKQSRQERIEIQWEFEPGETRREKFTKPEEIDRQVDARLAELTTGEDEEPKSWTEHKTRLEKHREKVKAKGYGWPPRGIVVYRRHGKPDYTVDELIARTEEGEG